MMSSPEVYEDSKKESRLAPLPVDYISKVSKILPDILKKNNKAPVTSNKPKRKSKGKQFKLEALNNGIQKKIKMRQQPAIPQANPYAVSSFGHNPRPYTSKRKAGKIGKKKNAYLAAAGYKPFIGVDAKNEGSESEQKIVVEEVSYPTV